MEKIEQVLITKKRSQVKFIWFRFKKNRLAMIGMVITIILMCVSIFAGILIDYNDVITQNMSERLKKPSGEHWFGTDQYGRDMFYRIIYGTRISLSLGLATIITSMLAGTLFGSVSAYYGGGIDNVLMRITDIMLAIPSMILAVAIVAALGTGAVNLFIAMSISTTPRFIRIVRSSVLQIKGVEFIEAAKACGTNDYRIITKHIIPNAIGPIIVQATLTMAQSILTIASLSFVGLGIPSPTPEWGTILSENKSLMRHYPYLTIFPGIAIIAAVMSLNFIGDGLRDALDPRLKN